MPLAFVMSPEPQTSRGARLVTVDGRDLPLTGTSLRTEAAGGIARTIVEQRFTNPHAEALTVTYSLPLPSDGAVSGFAFVIGGRRLQGEVQKRADARAEFERAVLEGRSAALLEQDRSSLFTQEIGNIPPGETVVAEVVVDQPLRWLAEGAWEWRFPTVVAPRYLGEPGLVPDVPRIAQDVAATPIAARFTLACTVRDALAPGGAPESPSHPMLVTHGAASRAPYREGAAGAHARAANGGALTLSIPEGARLDRDVVVRWPVATPRVGVALRVGRPAEHRPTGKRGYGLITLVPPESKSRPARVARDLIVLIDTSGSMGGEPLEQAKRVTKALIDTLDERDRLEMVEFSWRTSRFRAGPVAAGPEARREAIAWVNRLSAGGGTDMVSGILEALRSARQDAQRQVVVITDGQIGFESQVLSSICARLPPASRLHTVGVGSAVNRSLTGPAARAGRGVEVILGLGEDVERAVRRLVARTDAPIVVDLEIHGSAVVEHAPDRLPDLYAGAPALACVALRPDGGEIVVRGRTASGRWEQRLTVDPIDGGAGDEAIAALFGRESVEDRELALAAGGPRRSLDAQIERLGLDFQLATRLTSWIAVTTEATVDPANGTRKERMPHEVPHGMSAEQFGLRAATGDLALTALAGPVAMPAGAAYPSAPSAMAPQEVYAERSRKTALPAAVLIVMPIAFGIAYYFLRSFGFALLTAWAAAAIVLILRALFRAIFR